MTIDHLVITDAEERGDPLHESSVVKVLAGAGQATPTGRSVRRTSQKARNTTHAIRKTWNNVIAEPLSTWRRPESGGKKSSRALAGITGVQAAARGERIPPLGTPLYCGRRRRRPFRRPRNASPRLLRSAAPIAADWASKSWHSTVQLHLFFVEPAHPFFAS